MRGRTSLVGVACVTFIALVLGLILPVTLQHPPSLTFSNDAASYHAAATQLATSGFYSLDGITPYIEREPGYSIFLSLIYRLFGVGNRSAIFLVTASLYLFSVFLFTRELRHHLPPTSVTAVFLIALFFPSVFLSLSLVNREMVTLCLFLLLYSLLLSYRNERTTGKAWAIGLLLGTIVLTYLPFLFFPLIIGWILFLWKVPWRHVVLIVFLPFLFVSAWGMRNQSVSGEFSLTAGERFTGNMYMRAQKAANLQPLEHFSCLYREYLLRDFTNPFCMTNTILHGLGKDIREGRMTLEGARAESRSLLAGNVMGFIIGSVAEVLEFHFPFFDGNTIYNILALLSYILLYLGVLMSVPALWGRSHMLFLAPPLYAMLIFALTDATPRYHMPIIFCYVTLAVVGYSRVLPRLQWYPFPSLSRPTMKRKELCR
jgi:4-amino-4-deoxy-L-arabinose transferase-like glycosyltransferase